MRRGVGESRLGDKGSGHGRQEVLALVAQPHRSVPAAADVLRRQQAGGLLVVRDEARHVHRRPQEDRHVVGAGQLLPAVEAGRRLHKRVVCAEPRSRCWFITGDRCLDAARRFGQRRRGVIAGHEQQAGEQLVDGVPAARDDAHGRALGVRRVRLTVTTRLPGSSGSSVTEVSVLRMLAGWYRPCGSRAASTSPESRSTIVHAAAVRFAGSALVCCRQHEGRGCAAGTADRSRRRADAARRWMRVGRVRRVARSRSASVRPAGRCGSGGVRASAALARTQACTAETATMAAAKAPNRLRTRRCYGGHPRCLGNGRTVPQPAKPCRSLLR